MDRRIRSAPHLAAHTQCKRKDRQRLQNNKQACKHAHGIWRVLCVVAVLSGAVVAACLSVWVLCVPACVCCVLDRSRQKQGGRACCASSPVSASKHQSVYWSASAAGGGSQSFSPLTLWTKNSESELSSSAVSRRLSSLAIASSPKRRQRSAFRFHNPAHITPGVSKLVRASGGAASSGIKTAHNNGEWQHRHAYLPHRGWRWLMLVQEHRGHPRTCRRTTPTPSGANQLECEVVAREAAMHARWLCGRIR